MRRFRLYWLLGVALSTGIAVSVACDDGDGPGGDGQITLDEYDEAYIEVFCSFAARCPATGGDDLFYMTAGSTDASTCVSRMREALALGASSPGVAFQAAVARGAGTWDAVLAADCFTLIRNAACDDFQTGAIDVDHPECADMFHGSVASGSACYLDIDCVDGWCDNDTACPGTCVTYVAPDAACGGIDGGRCGPGYTCGDTGTCVPKTVAALADVGQACGAVNTECRYGLYCDERTESCRAYLDAGAACGEGTAECTPGTTCHPTNLVCTRVQFSSAAGTPCGEGTATLCDVLDNLFCDPGTLQCVQLPGSGQPCYAVGSFYTLCAAGNYCDGELCRTKLDDGAACELDHWCRSGECQGTCRPVAESCDSSDMF
ncbi:MAG: hypothetical protein JXB32_22385 [Deltaproteobacteria bacterium]|nr:hypothetical protein [Deltaproteobacteria bacterium]